MIRAVFNDHGATEAQRHRGRTEVLGHLAATGACRWPFTPFKAVKASNRRTRHSTGRLWRPRVGRTLERETLSSIALVGSPASLVHEYVPRVGGPLRGPTSRMS